MLVATVVAVLICFMVQSLGAPTPGKACWERVPSDAGRNSSCVAPEPYLIFGHGKAIHRMDLDGRNQRRLVAGVGSSILLDFHSREERIYWADRHTGVIYKASMTGTQRQKLYSSEKGISGLAVDWLWNRMYWTSEEKGTIKRMDTDGKNEKTFIRHLTQPSCIAVDPHNRFVFWLSAGMNPSIQRSNTVGKTTVTTLLKIPEGLRALSIDRADNRLFWVQFSSDGKSTIGSCDYDGNLINHIDQPLRSQSLGLSVFRDYVYYTDITSRAIRRVNKYNGGEPVNVNTKRLNKPPVDLTVVHPFSQPIEDDSQPALSGCDERTEDCVNVCSGPLEQGVCQCSEGFALNTQGNYCEDINECALWNHGCSLGCENLPGSYVCTCPQGYALLPDRKTCQEILPCEANMTQCGHGCLSTDQGPVCVCPEGSRLQEDGRTCTGCYSADRGGCSQLCDIVSPGVWECSCLPGYLLSQDRKHCTASGPPPYLLVANLQDIRRVDLDGSDQTLLEEPRGTIIALDYDPVQHNVYFASTVLKTIERFDVSGGIREVLVSEGLGSPEGLAIDWVNRKMYWTDISRSAVDYSTLDGLNRETIISEGLDKPRGIAVHPQAKKLFWTDQGSRPAVERSSLEGTERQVIASANLVTPSGLTIDYTEDRLFWCDRRRGVVETSSLDGADRRVLTENQVGQPFDLAVFEDRLWVSDWEGRHLRSIHKRTGKKLERIHGDKFTPASIVVVHPLAKPGGDVCFHQNGGCTHVCENRLGLAHCSCLSHYIQSEDGKGCLPVDRAFNVTAESGDSESADPISINNKTLNDESTPLVIPGPSDEEQAVHSDEGSEPAEKMVADQDLCYSLRCGVNAQCQQETGGSPTCRCLKGYIGDGKLCVDVDECVFGLSLCSTQGSECINTEGGYRCQCQPGFTGEGHHCADIDECKLGTHQCDQNAACQNTPGTYLCTCHPGYHGNGHICQEAESRAPETTRRPADVTTENSNAPQSCPSSHDSYCLYQGVCFYFPEMESYACNCMSGYMGERCQFSDLEWWDLQQAQEEKRRNVAIAASMLVIALLSIAGIAAYCYGSRRCFQKKHPSVDNISELSTTDDSVTETPRFYVVLEHGGQGKVVHVMGCPRRAVCPSCSSETGDAVVAEEVGSLPRHNQAYECSMVPTAAMETTNGSIQKLKSIDNLIFLDDPQPTDPETPTPGPQSPTTGAPCSPEA